MNIKAVSADIRTYNTARRSGGAGMDAIVRDTIDASTRQYGLKGPAIPADVLYSYSGQPPSSLTSTSSPPPSSPLSADMAENIAAFCFPHGVRPELLERTPSMSGLNEVVFGQHYQTQPDHSFVFRMSVADPGDPTPYPLYGVCCYAQELVHRPPALARNSFPGATAPLARYMVTAPRCYCLLTRHPFFELHFQVLHVILGLERLERMAAFAGEEASGLVHEASLRHSSIDVDCDGDGGGGGGSAGAVAGRWGLKTHPEQQQQQQQQQQRNVGNNSATATTTTTTAAASNAAAAAVVVTSPSSSPYYPHSVSETPGTSTMTTTTTTDSESGRSSLESSVRKESPISGFAHTASAAVNSSNGSGEAQHHADETTTTTTATDNTNNNNNELSSAASVSSLSSSSDLATPSAPLLSQTPFHSPMGHHSTTNSGGSLGSLLLGGGASGGGGSSSNHRRSTKYHYYYHGSGGGGGDTSPTPVLLSPAAAAAAADDDALQQLQTNDDDDGLGGGGTTNSSSMMSTRGRDSVSSSAELLVKRASVISQRLHESLIDLEGDGDDDDEDDDDCAALSSTKTASGGLSRVERNQNKEEGMQQRNTQTVFLPDINTNDDDDDGDGSLEDGQEDSYATAPQSPGVGVSSSGDLGDWVGATDGDGQPVTGIENEEKDRLTASLAALLTLNPTIVSGFKDDEDAGDASVLLSLSNLPAAHVEEEDEGFAVAAVDKKENCATPLTTTTSNTSNSSSSLEAMDILAQYLNNAVPRPGEVLHFHPNPTLSPIAFHRPLIMETLKELGMRLEAPALPDVDAAVNLGAWTISALCKTLSLESILVFLSAVLLERQVVLFCPDVGLLCGVALSLVPMLLPFSWQSLLLPVLPATPSRLDLLEAPVPFVVGVLFKTQEIRSRCGGLVRVNVYKDRVRNAGSVPLLPHAAALAEALTGPHAELQRAGRERGARTRPVHAVTETQAEMAQCFLSTVQKYLKGLMIDLKGYTITDVSQGVGEQHRVSVLLKDSFVDSFAVKDRVFMRQFAETQMFSVYCDAVL